MALIWKLQASYCLYINFVMNFSQMGDCGFQSRTLTRWTITAVKTCLSVHMDTWLLFLRQPWTLLRRASSSWRKGEGWCRPEAGPKAFPPLQRMAPPAGQCKRCWRSKVRSYWLSFPITGAFLAVVQCGLSCVAQQSRLQQSVLNQLCADRGTRWAATAHNDPQDCLLLPLPPEQLCVFQNF